MTAMLLKLLYISEKSVRVILNGYLHFCMVSLASFPLAFGEEIAISPAKIRFSGVLTCQ